MYMFIFREGVFPRICIILAGAPSGRRKAFPTANNICSPKRGWRQERVLTARFISQLCLSLQRQTRTRDHGPVTASFVLNSIQFNSPSGCELCLCRVGSVIVSISAEEDEPPVTTLLPDSHPFPLLWPRLGCAFRAAPAQNCRCCGSWSPSGSEKAAGCGAREEGGMWLLSSLV